MSSISLTPKGTQSFSKQKTSSFSNMKRFSCDIDSTKTKKFYLSCATDLEFEYQRNDDSEDLIKLKSFEQDLLLIKAKTQEEALSCDCSDDFISMQSFTFGSHDNSYMTDRSHIRKHLLFYLKSTQLVSAQEFLDSVSYGKKEFSQDGEKVFAVTHNCDFLKLEAFSEQLMCPIILLKTIDVALKIMEIEIQKEQQKNGPQEKESSTNGNNL